MGIATVVPLALFTLFCFALGWALRGWVDGRDDERVAQTVAYDDLRRALDDAEMRCLKQAVWLAEMEREPAPRRTA